jgi:hypothetical protein
LAESDQADATREAWLRVLAEMDEAAGSATDGVETPALWRAPADLGPLPADLEAQARTIAARQQRAIESLQEARLTVSRHLSALRTVPAARQTDRSVYLDVTG